MNDVLLLGILAILGADLALKLRNNKGLIPNAPSATRHPPYDSLFLKYAAKYGFPVADIVAIVDWESGFNPRAVNSETEADARKGRDVESIGLGQILYPDTARGLDSAATPTKLMEPEYNLSLVAKH